MDVFISYEHESKSIADNICSVLEGKGVRCWYAPRDVYGDYATAIVEAIERCKVFILVLNHNSSESPHVLNEVEMAYKRILNGEITIIPFKVDTGILSKAMEYYVKRLHWIDASCAPLDRAIQELYQKLVPILGLEQAEEKSSASDHETNLVRKANQYYSAEDIVEVERLRKEESLLYDIEHPYYDKLFFNRKDMNVLDFDALVPSFSVKRFIRPEVAKAVYMSYDENVVKEGQDLCKDKPNMKYMKCSGDVNELDEIFTTAMREMNIDGFDFINLTLAIMNLENPFKTLKKIRKYAKPNSVWYIRDVDDKLVFAYPDNNGLFEQIAGFYKYDTLSGSRHSGRQIYNYLKKLGAKDVRLERCGVNTSDMGFDKKRLLFDCWFGFIPNDFKTMLQNDPTDEKAKEVLAWLDEHYDDLEEEFFDDAVLFNSGYIIYTARF